VNNEGDGMMEITGVEHEAIKQSPFCEAMDVWVRWMRLKDQQHSNGDGNLQDTKDFMRTGEAIDVMVDDLPRVQWWAIYKSRGLNTIVWRFQECALIDAVERAEVTLTIKMQQHIATRRFFS